MRTIALAGTTAALAVAIMITGPGSARVSGPMRADANGDAQSVTASPTATPTTTFRSKNKTLTINGTAMTPWNPQAVDANGDLVATRYQTPAACKAAGGAVVEHAGYQRCRFATVGVGH